MPNPLLWLNSAAFITQKNGSILIGYGNFQTYPNSKMLDVTKPAFYVTDFFISEINPWIQYEESVELSVKDFLVHLKKTSLESPSWNMQNEEVFSAAFKDLQKLFDENKLEKAVPYVFTHTCDLMTTSRLLNSIHHGAMLLQSYPGYLYGHWFNEKGFLGFTPEILFERHSVEPQIIYTMALAGTKKLEKSHEFIDNKKESKEHCFVIEGLKETLSPLGEMKIEETRVLNLSKLCHLHTPIQVNLKNHFDYDLTVKCMHPTPALGAFPREQGMKWLADYQMKIDREHYGAPFGFHQPSKGDALCVVGIRQVQWNSSGMRIGAGCGVIKESIFENEWKEIELKIASIRNLLGL